MQPTDTSSPDKGSGEEEEEKGPLHGCDTRMSEDISCVCREFDIMGGLSAHC